MNDKTCSDAGTACRNMQEAAADALLVTQLLNIADQHEAIENSDDHWKHTSYLPQSARLILRQAAKRLIEMTHAPLKTHEDERT